MLIFPSLSSFLFPHFLIHHTHIHSEISFLPEKKIKATAKLPEVSLHITDRKGLEKDLFTIGEQLKVQVRMSDESVYGIFVRNIVARGGRVEGRSVDNDTSLVLIDKSGCPGEGRMMREVRRIDDNTKSLESVFEAFAFTGSNVLQLEAEVETCLDKCQAVRCQHPSIRSEDGEESLSFGRRRRSPDPTVEIKTKDGVLIHAGDVLRKQTIAKKIKIRDPDPLRPSSTKAKVTRKLVTPGYYPTIGSSSIGRGTILLFVIAFFMIYLIFLLGGIFYLKHRHSLMSRNLF